MLKVVTTSRFEREIKRMVVKGKREPGKIRAVMGSIARQTPLEPKHRDHKHSGNFTGCRECHVELDWLLVYEVGLKKETVTFMRTGTHSDIFR